MPKKKGLSLDEKRAKLLEMFYDKKEVLNLKEVEKFGAKKGITLQTVKDVNQSLIDDNLVETDKIGIGCYFWALPSKGFQTRKNLIQDYDKKIEETKKGIADSEQQITKESAARDSTEGGREQMVAELEKLEKKKAELGTKLKQFERSDPKILLKISQDTKISKDAINRWTDNLFLILQWIQQSWPGFMQKDLEGSFPIYRNLDYVE